MVGVYVNRKLCRYVLRLIHNIIIYITSRGFRHHEKEKFSEYEILITSEIIIRWKIFNLYYIPIWMGAKKNRKFLLDFFCFVCLLACIE